MIRLSALRERGPHGRSFDTVGLSVLIILFGPARRRSREQPHEWSECNHVADGNSQAREQHEGDDPDGQEEHQEVSEIDGETKRKGERGDNHAQDGSTDSS